MGNFSLAPRLKTPNIYFFITFFRRLLQYELVPRTSCHFPTIRFTLGDRMTELYKPNECVTMYTFRVEYKRKANKKPANE